MPLTPEDVSNKRFTPVRLREGYDMGEVDQFLDEVEAELERLVKESDDLRSKLAAALDGAPIPATPPVEKPAEAEKPVEKAAEKPVEAEKPEPPQEVIKVITAAEASSAATRLLELATRNADEVVAEAREDAEKIVTEARTEAEKLESETKARTDKLEQDARARAQNLDSETDTRRREVLGEIEKEKGRLDGEVETLRSFEREYRSRLKSYFSQQLQALDGSGEGGELPISGEEDQPNEGQHAQATGAQVDGAQADEAEKGDGDKPQS
jgi:DivIVA domain-containing protein